MLDVLQQAMEDTFSELQGGQEDWQKPQELCENVIQQFFVSLNNMEVAKSYPNLVDKKGNIKVKKEDIEYVLQEALDQLSNNDVKAGLKKYNIEDLINFAIMSNCEVSSGNEYKLSANLREKLDIEPEDDNLFESINIEAGSVIEIGPDKGGFAESKEMVLRQLSLLIPQECEEYYPRTIIPNADPDRCITDLRILEDAYDENLHVCLIGDCGSGKTLALKKMAFDMHLPYKSLSFNGACTIEDLLGTFRRGRRSDTGEIDWLWIDGWLAKLARYGGIFVAEEINAAPPEILFVLHDLLGHVSHKLDLTQAGGDIIDAHSKFFFACTMNPDYDGTNKLNAALMDRFDIVLDFPYDSNLEKNFIKDRNLLAFADALRAIFPIEISTPPSPRMMQQYERNATKFGREVARQILINKFNLDERDIVATIFDSKMGGSTRRGQKP